MNADIREYNQSLDTTYQKIGDLLAAQISQQLPETESKVWHAHPVWFLDGNPIVGYSKQKAGMRLMFWSGLDFNEPALDVPGKKFKDASIFLNAVAEVNTLQLQAWLEKARVIQWDYKNIVRRKGRLERVILDV